METKPVTTEIERIVQGNGGHSGGNGHLGTRAARLGLALFGTLLLASCGGSGGGATPPPPPPDAPTVSTIAVGTPRYSQVLLITVDGTRLDLLPAVTAPGCNGIARSTTAPNVSSATRAFYTCTLAATGAGNVSVAWMGAALRSQAYSVPEPQVTLSLSGGATGDIVLTLDPTRVPVTVDNFLRYVTDGFYNGTTFHRVLAGFVAQGGLFLPPAVAGGVPAAQAGLRGPIALEVGRGLSNVALSVAMARAAPADSATASFFINLEDNRSSLDPGAGNPGYAVFGSVTTGAAVVTAVAAAPCAPVGGHSECAPHPAIVISTAAQTR